jgi:RNA-directed DNA polymerase
MKLSEDDQGYVCGQFRKMRSKEDLLSLLNFVKSKLFGSDSIAFELKQLTFHGNPSANRNRYFNFSIKKKSGGQRSIYSPTSGLKAIQKCLNQIFQCIYLPDKAAMGFVRGRSIVSNATVHSGNIYIYNIDLKDFFPSIDQARIWGRLKHPPFNLNEKYRRIELNNLISSLCCHEMEVTRIDGNGNWVSTIKNAVPQGAPTSPVISNIICQQLDFYLTAVAKRFQLKYTRYADDITFSSMHNVYQENGDFVTEVRRIIKSQNFYINDSKVRLQKKGYRQEVTGLIVNDKVNVSSGFVKHVRLLLYLWESHGYKKANKIFESFSKEKDQQKSPALENIIRGKLNYIRMVKGLKDTTYLKLNDRYEKLMSSMNPYRKVLDVWEKEGIIDAIEIFYTEKLDRTND